MRDAHRKAIFRLTKKQQTSRNKLNACLLLRTRVEENPPWRGNMMTLHYIYVPCLCP